jgi:hypothetical protein
MDTLQNHLTTLYNNKGELQSVQLSPELWSKVEHEVLPILQRAFPEKRVRPEPVNDWCMLKEYWDFQYPVDASVHCDICGCDTHDWEHDDPRKFKLLACNLGGLVRFECEQCHARIMKRHFKTHIAVESRPAEEFE